MVFIPPPSSRRHAEASPRLVRRLLDEGATSEWSARPLTLERRRDQRALAASLEAGMIHRTDQDTYWVDAEKWSRCRARQARVVVGAIAAVLLLFAILHVLGEFP